MLSTLLIHFIFLSDVFLVPCHRSIARPQVADEVTTIRCHTHPLPHGPVRNLSAVVVVLWLMDGWFRVLPAASVVEVRLRTTACEVLVGRTSQIV